MKKTAQVLIGLAVLLVGFWAISAALGVLFWGVVVSALGGGLYLLGRTWYRKRLQRKRPAQLEQHHTDSDAARALKELQETLDNLES